MKHPYEYRPLLYFVPGETPGKPNFGREETQRQIVKLVNDLFDGLPKVIDEEMEDNEGWEFNSHSFTIAGDNTVLLSMLLQRRVR